MLSFRALRAVLNRFHLSCSAKGAIPKRTICCILLAISVMLGCSATAHFYPVQGPLSAQTPAPVLTGKITGALSPGTISVVLSDGEVCKARWAMVRPPKATPGAPTASAAPADLSSAWDTIYGPGFYVSHVLGARMYARATATGNRGTVVNLEVYMSQGGNEAGRSAIKGVAKDDKGNIYKMVIS